jgi:SAM-dependent methyltransferase
MLRDRVYSLVADRLAPQVDAYTWRRYAVIEPFLVAGPVRALNIGTGGGIETLRLLRRGNHVTTVELNEYTAAHTRERVERAGFGDRHVGLCGHVMEVPLEGPFHVILMSEVLEHVQDDLGTLRRLASWLEPGGQLVLSTPTASWGMIPGDTLSVSEDGGHMRAGYDGPELDAMLADVGLTTIRRVFACGWGAAQQHVMERKLRGNRLTRPLGIAFGLASRTALPLLDAVPLRPTDQITLATKRPR